MLKIIQSKEFKKDFAQYKRDIENILNEDAKKECYNILNSITKEFSYTS